jgi:hypothetical protein
VVVRGSGSRGGRDPSLGEEISAASLPVWRTSRLKDVDRPSITLGEIVSPAGWPVCAECGFDASVISETRAGEAIRTLGARYHEYLTCPRITEDPDVLRRRPSPDTWSALEYAAHMRDVIALWGWALHQTLSRDRPILPAGDSELPDRVAFEAAYNTQDPLAVDRELLANAERMAIKVSTIGSEQWQRTAVFGDIEVSPLWIVCKVAHEGHHHELDMERSLRLTRTD